jgi:FMN phosphatase YigB (HAD superfamily)
MTRRRPGAVTFDCWNTLIRDRDLAASGALRVEALVEAARGLGREVSSDAAAAAIRAAHERHLALWSRGVGSGSPEMAAWALAALEVADAAAAARLGARFEEAGLASEVEALAGAGDTLEQLAGHGVRIGLVCDTGFSGGRIVRRLLEHAGLLRYLEVQVFSNEVGVPKPHRRMFEAALTPLGTAASAAVHVGDLRSTDVAGGRAMGMGTVRIRAAFDDRSALPDADAVVEAHADLIALLLERP